VFKGNLGIKRINILNVKICREWKRLTWYQWSTWIWRGNLLKKKYLYLMNWNILVIRGKKINRDFVSSGERKW